MLLIFSDTYRSFVKKVFLRILQISQENNSVGDPFLIIFQLSRPVTLLKESPTKVFSCEICEILKSIYLEEHLQTTASVLTLTHKKGIKKVLSHKLLKILSLNPLYYRSKISYMQQTK